MNDKKRINLLGGLVCLMVFSCANIYAQGNPNIEEVPEGMELVEMSPGYKILVPKGQKINKMGDANILENISVYVGRRFSQMESRLIELESKQRDHEAQIAALKEELAKTQNDLQAFSKEGQEK